MSILTALDGEYQEGDRKYPLRSVFSDKRYLGIDAQDPITAECMIVPHSIYFRLAHHYR